MQKKKKKDYNSCFDEGKLVLSWIWLLIKGFGITCLSVAPDRAGFCVEIYIGLII